MLYLPSENSLTAALLSYKGEGRREFIEQTGLCAQRYYNAIDTFNRYARYNQQVAEELKKPPLDRHVIVLGLSVRGHNALANCCQISVGRNESLPVLGKPNWKALTLRDVLKFPISEYMRIPNFGRRTAEEMKRGFALNGLEIS